MATNAASNFSSDVISVIAEDTLPLVRRRLIAYQFADKDKIPKGRGTTFQYTRYNRVPLPYASLSEGVPPVGESMTISTVTATALQWGDKITISDVAELTIYHPVYKQATELLALQIGETLERNTFNALMAGTQVVYANGRTSRANLTGGDVFTLTDINKIYGLLDNAGAPRFMGDEMTDPKVDAQKQPETASNSPAMKEHYVAIIHTLAARDITANSTLVTAWSYSDINRLYNNEIGEIYGIRFCSSQMVPTFTYRAAVTVAAGTSGNLATGSYYVQCNGVDTQNQYETIIGAVSSAAVVTGPNGSVSVTTPNVAGYTWTLYIGTTSTGNNTLALSPSGPTTGPQQGQAVQIPSNTTVTLTGIGAAQTPPAQVGSGVTTAVFPTFIFGRGAYAQVELDDVKWTYLTDADKADPLNQLLVVGWKCFYATAIKNQTFMYRYESLSAYG